MIGRLAAALLVVMSAGCATAPQTRQLTEAPPDDLKGRIELTGTPFHPQEAYQCGPAALATVLGAAGRAVGPDVLKEQVYLPERRGSLARELAAAARRHGMVPYPLQGGLMSLLRELDARHPVLVLQNLGLDWLPRWHYAVVVGYALQEQVLILRSGTRRRHRVSFSTFERTWHRAEYWGLVVLPPGKLPATAAPLAYLEAASDFERQSRYSLAAAAYRGAVERWQNSLEARLGLGNALYAGGDLGGAEVAYREILKINPEYAPALNNLAEILFDAGHQEAAESMAARAVSLGGPFVEQYRATLRDIRRRSNSDGETWAERSSD